MARYFNDWLKAYLKYTKHSESPRNFHFWTGVATVAAALKRRVWIDQRYFQWTPNFYIVLVGPPGVAAKSTSLRLGLNLLKHMEVPPKLGPTSMTWQALANSLNQAQEMLVMDEHTLESQPISCISCYVSELGTFLNPHDKELVDVLVSLWDGQLENFDRRTATQGNILIENPWINIISCTTPSWLSENFPEAMVGGGLTSRMIFVYGETKRHLVPYPSQLQIAEDHADMEKKLIHDLELIGQMKGEYTLSEEALDWGRDWYKEHWEGDRAAHLENHRYDGYLARKQTHLHKVAMVLAAASRDSLIITKDDLEKANAFIEIIEHDMVKVFQSIGASDTQKHLRHILGYVKHSGSADYTQVWRQCLASMTFAEFEAALAAGVQAGLLDQIAHPGGNKTLKLKGDQIL